jgi:hypothetical protein
MENNYVTTNVREFILGGKSEFTIFNVVNGIGYKYHIKSNKEYSMWFISVKLAGSFRYAGFIKKDANGRLVYCRGKKGSMDGNNTAIKGLLWTIDRSDRIPFDKVKIIHHGRCAVCGKPLTDELSIERGIGPICYKRVTAIGI